MKLLVGKLLIMTLLLWTSFITLHATNVVTVNNVQGSPGDQVEIKISLSTETANIVAAEIHLPLPDNIEPLEESLSLNSTRIPDHSVTTGMNGGEYVIVLFNTSLKTVPVGDGDLLTFKVMLGDNPGHFDLTPKVKLSDGNGSTIDTKVLGGKLSVIAPRMELGVTTINFGRVPILSKEVRQLKVVNTGTSPLTVSSYDTGVEGLTAVLPGIIGAGESATIELNYCPTIRSKDIDGRLAFISDGVGRSQFVRIQSEPFSVNELHIGNASGICDSEISVSMSMDNMEPIVGLDITIPLSDELDFVDGSIKKGTRASAMVVESCLSTDKKLRIILYDVNNKAIDGKDGELLSFRLKLKGRSGGYTINPIKTVMTNASGENMVSAVYPGEIRIKSPKLSASSEWAIGNVPLSGTDTFFFSIRSEGEVPLTIEKVVFLDDIADCDNQFPLVIEPYEKKNISVKFKQPEFGSFVTTMNIYTNDPDNRMKSVDLTGNFYSPNEMFFVGRNDNGNFSIDASLVNEETIAAMQLDVVCPDGVTTDESLLKLSSRAVGHSATLANVEKNRYRLIIFSFKNTPFVGNDGVIFSLGFNGNSLAGKRIMIENIKLSSVDGVNITTPDSEVKVGELPISGSCVDALLADPNAVVDVYDINGILIKRACPYEELRQLKGAVYILRSGNNIIKAIFK